MENLENTEKKISDNTVGCEYMCTHTDTPRSM